MIHYNAALLAGLLAVTAADAQNKKADPKQPPAPKGVRITWHGQSFFEITSGKGTNLVLDPHQIQEYGKPVLPIKADAIFVSHLHNDHNQVQAVANVKDLAEKKKIFFGLSGTDNLRANWNKIDVKVKDVHVRSIASYHDDQQGIKFGKNTIFVLDVDGWKIAYLGDLGHPLTPAQLKQLGTVDVVLIPVGGVYALNGSEAKAVIEQIKPREYVIPMHYGTAVYDDLLSVNEFLDGQKKTHVVKAPSNFVVLNRNPDRPRPTIVVLSWWPTVKRERPKDKDK
jgi:L-ascorbate metabolism protein UlaG (beta-lactamase superfamily)